MTILTVQNDNIDNNNSMYKSLINAVNIHRKAMQLVF